jgi:hypothetical protein
MAAGLVLRPDPLAKLPSRLQATAQGGTESSRLAVKTKIASRWQELFFVFQQSTLFLAVRGRDFSVRHARNAGGRLRFED